MTEKYKFEDLHLTPNKPGIYAWYLQTTLRPADINDKNATKKNLIRIANQLSLPSFNVEAKGNLSLLLKGRLNHFHIGSENGPSLTDLVEEILSNQNSRKLFSEIIKTSSPHLISPLYIGVSNNIRSRLQSHKKDIELYRESHRTSSDKDLIENYKQKFAREIVHRGIPNRYLEVYISTNYKFSGTDDEIRKTSEAVESVLNRLFYPIFGRR